MICQSMGLCQVSFFCPCGFSYPLQYPRQDARVSSTGNSTISNQLVAGSIIVRHMKSISVPSLPFMVYGPMRSTQRVCHGFLITCLGGNLPYCFCLFLLTWHFLQFLTYALTVLRIPFQYMEPLKVSSSRVDPGCCK